MTRARLAPLLLLALAAGCGTSGEPQAIPDTWFVDATAESGIEFTAVSGGAQVDYIIESLGSGAGWLDYDGDGDPDLYLAQGASLDDPQGGPPDMLWRNDGGGRFTDVTAESGLGDTHWSFGVAVGDADGDGAPDLYVTNWGANRLYLNRGGRFVETAAAAGVAGDGLSASASFADVDRDGDYDLFVTNYVEFTRERYPARGEPLALSRFACRWRALEIFCGPRNLEPALDRLYVNEGDADGDGVPAFRDATAGALGASPGFGLGARFLDADGDGDDDLYVANDSVANAFFVNRGDGRFEESALYAGLAFNEEGHEQAGMGVTSGDYDGDGRLDIAVTNFSHDHDTLYHNEGDGYFLDLSYPAGIGTPSFLTLGWGVAFADFDLDAAPDLFVAHGHVYPQVDGVDLGTTFRQRDSLFRNLGDGRFEHLDPARSGLTALDSSRGLALADWDTDGDVDAVVTAHNAPPRLWRNEAPAGNWIAVDVRDAAGGSAIGAAVRLAAGGRTQLREIRRDGSFLSSHEPQARFGLGAATAADWIEVRFPSGERRRFENVAAGTRLKVEASAP